MSYKNKYTIGQNISLMGCFTDEYSLRGMSVLEIGRELGLPLARLSEGVYVAWAVQLPTIENFKLGGWAEYSTDHFVRYQEKQMVYSEKKYMATLKGKRMPISIEEAKKSWLMHMNNEKLIKIVPVIPHQEGDHYPPGGKAAQLIVTNPILCQVAKFLHIHEVFRGTWQ